MDDKTLSDLFSSLTSEIAGAKDSVSSELSELRTEMREGFSRIEARLGRQGGIINGGARQVARLVEWSEKIDALIADRDATLRELKERVERLERKQS
jgi:hypothetical protein